MDLRRLHKVIRRFVRSLPNRQWFRFFTLWLAPFLILMADMLAAVTHSTNLLEIFPGNLVIPTAMHAFTALLVATLAYRLKRPRYMGAKLIIVAVLGSLFVDFESRLQSIAGVIQGLLPSFLGKENFLVSSLTLIGMAVVVAIWLGCRMEYVQRKHKSLSSSNLFLGFFIFTGFLVGGNAIHVLAVLPDLSRQAQVIPEPLAAPQGVEAPSDRPDIYYLVVDRYTSQDVLSKEFGYDNSQFTEFLSQSGFFVSDNAQANYPYTDMSVASTINTDYLAQYAKPFADTSTQSHSLYHNLIQQSSVVKALKNAGYSYHHIGTWYNATSRSPLADVRYVTEWRLTLLGRAKVLTSFEGQELARSPYYRLLTSKVASGLASLQETKGAALVEEQLLRLREVAEAPKQGGRFVFAHLLSAHHPYYFNADGSYAAYTMPDNSGQHVRTKYINQVEFTNMKLQEIIASIKEKSGGNAVILLTSDEGPYPDEMNPGVAKADFMAEWSDEWLQMKYGVLQAVYIPKATSGDLEHLSNVNMFRIVMNRYLGYKMDYLPQCNLAPKSRNFQFTHVDLTRRLTGTTDPYCDTVTSGG